MRVDYVGVARIFHFLLCAPWSEWSRNPPKLVGNIPGLDITGHALARRLCKCLRAATQPGNPSGTADHFGWIRDPYGLILDHFG